MEPAVYDFPIIVRGDTCVLEAILKDRDVLTQAVSPMDLAGATITWTIFPAGRDPILRTSAQGGGLGVTLATATVANPLSAADTQALTDTNAYRLRVAFPDGTVRTLLVGSIPTQA